MGVETAALLWRTVPPIILVVGICGNILTILVLTRPASRKSSTAIYLIALAIADTVVLNTGLLRFWIIYTFGVDVSHFGDVGCRLSMFFAVFATQMSSWFLVAVTFERIISIMWPHKVRVLCTPRSALIVVSVLFVIFFGGTVHILFGVYLKKTIVAEHGTRNRTRFLPNSTSTFDNSSHNLNETTDVLNTSHTNKPLLERSSVYSHFTTASNLSGLVPADTTALSDINMINATLFYEMFFTSETTTMAFYDNTSSTAKQNMSNVPITSNGTQIYSTTLRCSFYNNPDFADFYRFIYPWVSLLVYVLIPTIILVIGNIIIISKLNSSRNLRKSMLQSDSARNLRDKNTSLTVMLLTVNTMYVLCTTPFTIWWIGLTYWSKIIPSQHIGTVGAAVNFLLYLNNAMNFILYFLRGSRFRQSVIDMFCKKQYPRAKYTNAGTGPSKGTTQTTSLNDTRF